MMKNNKKWIVLSIFILIGIILSLLGFFMGGNTGMWINSSGIHLISHKQNEIKEENLEEFQNIQIAIKYANIKIESSDHYGIEILSHLYEQNKEDNIPQIVWKLENQTLVISENPAIKSNFNFSFGFFVDTTPYIKVYLPKNAILHLTNIESTNGNVDIKVGHIDELKLNNSYGNILLQDIQIGTATLTAKNGNIKLKNSKISDLKMNNKYGNILIDETELKNISIDSTNGKVSIDNRLLENNQIENLIVSNKYGDLHIDGTEIQNTTIEATNGNITIQSNLLGNSDIRSQYGNIKIQTKQPESYYNCNMTTKYGDISINNNRQKDTNSYATTNENGKALKLNTNNGNIKINFGL